MRWWSRTAAQILIADGSDDPNARLKNLSDSSITVSYINTVSLSDRFRWASTKVQKKYTLIAGDDDLYLFSGVLACIKVLEAEVEVGTCIGQAMRFTLNGADFKTLFSAAYPENLGYERHEVQSAGRTIARGCPYTVCCFYGVQRTQISQVLWQLLAEMGEPDLPPHQINLYLYEMTYEFVSTYLALVKTVVNLMWLRSSENVPLREIEGPKNIQFHNWVALRSSESAMQNWFKILIENLAPLYPYVKTKDLTGTFERAIEGYLTQFSRKNLSKYLDPQRYKLRFQHEVTKAIKRVKLHSCIRQKFERVFGRNGPVRVTEISVRGNNVAGYFYSFEGRLIDTEELREVTELIGDFHRRK